MPRELLDARVPHAGVQCGRRGARCAHERRRLAGGGGSGGHGRRSATATGTGRRRSRGKRGARPVAERGGRGGGRGGRREREEARGHRRRRVRRRLVLERGQRTQAHHRLALPLFVQQLQQLLLADVPVQPLHSRKYCTVQYIVNIRVMCSNCVHETARLLQQNIRKRSVKVPRSPRGPRSNVSSRPGPCKPE